MHILSDTCYAVNGGSNVGLTRDFGGNPIYQTPDIGIYEKYNSVSLDSCIFIYGNWSSCNGSFQTRTYTRTPSGCVGNPPVDSIQRSCTSQIVINSFFYSNDRKSIRINCNYAGTMVISNVLGNIVRTVSYRANGQWINLTNLPAGVYFAGTYGRSITFVR
jgi:hypothetical protein